MLEKKGEKYGYTPMSNNLGLKSGLPERMVYQIRLRGHLGEEWTDWFEGMTINLLENGDTLITGPVVDQAFLYALLKKIRDLGMPLLSVNCLESDRPQAPNVKLQKLSISQSSIGSSQKEKKDEK